MVVVVLISTVVWLEANGGRALGCGGAAGSEKTTGGSEELGLLLSTVVWPTLTGLLGGGRFCRKFGSRYSDRSILRPRLGRGGSQVVWCLYMARRLSPTCFHLRYKEPTDGLKSRSV